METMIVEDNTEAREGLARMVDTDIAELTLAGSAGSVVEAAKLANQLQPELLLLDIELPDGNGFDLLQLLNYSPKVIFITGSEEYAIRAFRVSAIDYLLKPVTAAQLKEAVGRAQALPAPGSEQIGIANKAIKASDFGDRIALYTADQISIKELSDIYYCNSEGNYTHFFFSDGSSLLVSRTLKDFDEMLSGKGFLRVHQSYLVNMTHVDAFVRHDGGYLVLKNSEKIPVSTRRRQVVIDFLSRI